MSISETQLSCPEVVRACPRRPRIHAVILVRWEFVTMTRMLWIGPEEFVSGDPDVTIEYPNVSHPWVTVVRGRIGDTWVRVALRLPPLANVQAVHVGYGLTSTSNYIAQTRLRELQEPTRSPIIHDDPTPLLSTAPTTYVSIMRGATFDSAALLELRLSFGNSTDPIQLGAIGVEYDQPDYVNVRDFGATGDGTTDDTDAIRDALEGAERVYFPKGTYSVTTLTIRNGHHLFGDGFESVLKRKDSLLALPDISNQEYALIFGNGVRDIIIEKLTVDGNEANQPVMSQSGYRKGRATQAEVKAANIYVLADYVASDPAQGGTTIIRDIQVLNAVENGIAVNNHAMASITGCSIRNCGKNGGYLAQVGGDQCVVSGNRIEGCGRIYGGGLAVAVSSVAVSGNVIIDSHEYGIFINSTGNGHRPTQQVTITGNIVRVVRRRILDTSGSLTSFVDSPLGVGIAYHSPSGGGGDVGSGDHPWLRRLGITIHGNSVVGCGDPQTPTGGIGISVAGGSGNTYRPHGISLHGNTVILTGNSGIDVRHADSVVVTGNLIRGPGFAGVAMQDSNDSLVEDNVVTLGYDIDDEVVYHGRYYRALRRHYSLRGQTPDIATSDWTDVGAASSPSTRPQWEPAQYYAPKGYGSGTQYCYWANSLGHTARVGRNAYGGLSHAGQIGGNVTLVHDGYAPAEPTTGFWQRGMRIYNVNASAGEVQGWVCTQRGLASRAPLWSEGSYDRGDLVKNGSPLRIYRCIAAGTSRSPGPTGDAPTETGTAQWETVDLAAIFRAMPTL
jgi:hypothetical protein